MLLIYLGPSKPAVGLEQVRFTSGVYFDDSGLPQHVEHPSLPKYVGPPCLEIDEAWDKILRRK
jgi:hypothetical protein